MKHRIGYNRLGRKASHRKALIKNMVTQLYRHERIRTTKSKALEVRRKAEKFITKAKEDTLHNRRTIGKLIQDKEILAKLFTDIAPSFASRPGGYTRILKIGYRKGDAAEMVILELVEREGDFEPKKKAKKESKAQPEPEEALEEPAEADEVAADEVEESEETAEEPAEEAEASAEQEEAAAEEPEEAAEEAAEEETEEENASKEG